MPVVLHPDPFSPVMLNSRSLAVSGEQRNFLKEILDIACSDSRFAEKAYQAIQLVLTAGSAVPPVVTSLDPPSAQLGSVSFTLEVLGTGFTPASVIIFNGGTEPTTFVSATKLTTGVDMSTAVVAVSVPVEVLNGDGVQSDPATFTFTEAPLAFAASAHKSIPLASQKK